jgi:hypothetical protein
VKTPGERWKPQWSGEKSLFTGASGSSRYDNFGTADLEGWGACGTEIHHRVATEHAIKRIEGYACTKIASLVATPDVRS